MRWKRNDLSEKQSEDSLKQVKKNSELQNRYLLRKKCGTWMMRHLGQRLEKPVKKGI